MSGETPSFFALPLELREVIYKEALSQGAQLLRVCREVHSETQKYLYQRHIIFRSQSALLQWLEKKPEDLLQHVQDILIELQDVDLTPILIPTPSNNLTERSRSLRTWELYEEELQALNRAFRRLPNVKTLTIRALPGKQTHLYDDFLAMLLRMLVDHYPALKDLSLEGNMHNQSISFLRPLKALTAFSFDGFSASGATETAAILSSLSLTQISIVSQHSLLTSTQGQHSSLVTKSQSFDSSLLRIMNQLASLSVIENFPTTSSALFFTTEILGSLHSHATLSSLSICLSRTPDEDTLDALNEFLATSTSVNKLELDWPQVDSNVLYILTNRLMSLWIRAASLKAASAILNTILETRKDGGVEQLRRVVLMRSHWKAEDRVENVAGGDEDTHDGKGNLIDFASTKGCLNEFGVGVAWCTDTA